MKQIFDWLRKRAMSNDYLYKVDGFHFLSRTEVGELINEAEAKWEADCCIRVIGKPFTSSCGRKFDKWTYVGEPYCAKCGKRIKILEDE